MKINRFLRRIINQKNTLEARMFWFTVSITILVEAICLTANLVIGLDNRMNAFLVLGIVLGCADAVYCSASENYSLCYSLFVLLINLVVQPAAFLFGGGFHSGTPAFLALGLVACSIHPNAKSRYLTSLISAFGYGILFWTAVKHPEFVTPIPEESFVFDLSVSIIVCALAIIGMLSFVNREIQVVYKEQMREYTKKTRMRMDLLESQTESIEEAKHQRDEMRRHNMIVTGYAEKGDVDGLIDYLSKKKFVDEKYNKKKIYCMNSVINSVLGIYSRQAAKSKIPMEIHTDVEPEIPIRDPDLVTLVSSILENAIAGAENSGNSEKRVSVDIHTKEGKLIITCKNTCNPRIDLSSGYPGHPGIGIGIVEKIVRNNGGLLKYQMENGVIQTKLVMNMGE